MRKKRTFDRKEMLKDPIVSAALKYAKYGLRPVVIDNITDNYTTNGKKLNELAEIGQDESAAEDIIFKEFAPYLGECNIALNVVLSGIIAIDIDNHGDEDGNKTLSDWMDTTGLSLPDTVECITPRNGRHYIYRLTERFSQVGNGNTAHYFINHKGYVNAAGIEIMKNNNTITMPPSVRKGVGTEKYTFVKGHALGEIEIASADENIISLIEYLYQIGTKKDESRKLLTGFNMPVAVKEGERQNTLMRLTGSLHAKGLSDEAIRSAVKIENETRCTPPLTDEELEKTVFPVMANYPKGSFSEKAFQPFIPFDRLEYPESVFPVDVLPPIMRNYCKAVSESLQVPVDMPCIAALGVLSASVTGKYYVELKKDWKQPVNLYLLLIARPSERKSPVMDIVAKPLYSYQNDYNYRHRENIDNYAIDLSIAQKKVDSMIASAASLKKAQGKNVIKNATDQDAKEAKARLTALELDPVTELSLLLDDVTPEAVATKLYTSRERAAIFSAEGGGIFGMMQGRYTTNTNIDIFLKAYSGEEYRVDRIGRPSLSLRSPLLTLLLMAQETVLSSAVSDENLTGRGLTARFLFSIPQSKVGSRSYDTKQIPDKIQRDFETKIHRLLVSNYETPKEVTKTVTLSDEAAEVFKQYAEEIEKQLPELSPLLENWSGKIAGTVARIAAILTLFESADNRVISVETMQAAVEIGKYFQDHALYTFEYIGAADSKAISDAKYIFSKIAKNRTKTITKRDLHQAMRNRFPKAEMMSGGLRELESHGYIRINKIKTGGAPSEIIEVNPESF